MPQTNTPGRFLLVLAACLLVGHLAGYAVAQLDASEPPEQTSAAARTVEENPDSNNPLPRTPASNNPVNRDPRCQALEGQNQALRTKIVNASVFLTSLRERAEGRPNPWPEGWVMDAEGVEAFGSTVRKALEQSLPGAELMDVDCAECPCIASIRLGQAIPAGFEATRKLVNSQAWIGAFGEPQSWGTFPLIGFPLPVDCGDGRKEQTLLVNSLDNCREDPEERMARTAERILKGLPENEEDLLFMRRMKFRKEQILESWRCQVEGDEGR